MAGFGLLLSLRATAECELLGQRGLSVISQKGDDWFTQKFGHALPQR